MDITTILAFAVVAAVAIATPGPTVLLAFSNGSRYGARRALAGMAGAVLSDFVLVAAVSLGLGALLAASEFWFNVLKWLGVVYLAWLGLAMIRSQGSLSSPATVQDDGRGTARRLFQRSFLVAVTNPKGYLFASAFLPQFIDPSAPQALQYMLLGLVFAGLDFFIMLVYALTGAQAAALLTGHAARWLDRLCGGALLALAGTLAVYRRAPG
jgi:threonine/homoserine/homoserine lactone efflux protein